MLPEVTHHHRFAVAGQASTSVVELPLCVEGELIPDLRVSLTSICRKRDA